MAISKSPNNYYALNKSVNNSNSFIGGASDFNNGTGAEKKRVAPGNASQQNANPFGHTDRGFKPTLRKSSGLATFK